MALRSDHHYESSRQLFRGLSAVRTMSRSRKITSLGLMNLNKDTTLRPYWCSGLKL